jgi:hypothetical protein
VSEFAIPKDIEVQAMLGMLYDGVSVKPSDLVPTEGDSKTIVAVYIDDEDKPVSVCACDYSFTAFAGGALTRIPKGGAEDAASSGEFSKMMMDNLYEVMNICSRLFMGGNTPHLRLEKTYMSPGEAVEGTASVLSDGDGKAGFSVDIPGYGVGQLSFITV